MQSVGTFFSALKQRLGPGDSDWSDTLASESIRDRRLDSLRGLALVIMMIDHLQGALKGYTYQVFGFVTAAEMFIFLSGLVAGMVYSRHYVKTSYRDLRSKCNKRAFTLYVYHILTFGILIVISRLSSTMYASWNSGWIPNLNGSIFLESPAKALGLGSTLIYQPTHLDILPMYALLLLALPWALGITRRWGPLPLLIIAVSLWTLAMGGRTYNWMGEQLAPMDLRPPYFDLVAWQLLFWIGLIC